MVSILSLWFLNSGFELRWAYFFLLTLIDWKVTEMCLPFSRLNGHWMVTEMRLTENHLSRHHSVAVQLRFSHNSVDWKVRYHPVFPFSIQLCTSLISLLSSWLSNILLLSLLHYPLSTFRGDCSILTDGLWGFFNPNSDYIYTAFKACYSVLIKSIRITMLPVMTVFYLYVRDAHNLKPSG